MKAKYYPNLFQMYEKHGRNWIRELSEEDKRIFGQVGLQFACARTNFKFWQMGGRAHSKNALRDNKGRFIKTQEVSNA